MKTYQAFNQKGQAVRVTIPESEDTIETPIGKTVTAGLRYDGTMMDTFYQFTDIDENSPAYTATFYLHINGFTWGKLEEKWTAKRAEFKQ